MDQQESKRAKERHDQFFKDQSWLALKDPWARSRLLYPNPVCILTTQQNDRLNAMVVTWIMSADNNGGVIASINRKRHSATALSASAALFTLSVASKGMESLLLQIGSCSGSEVDKFKTIKDLNSLPVPWENGYPDMIDSPGVLAVMSCKVISIADGVDKDHMTVMAKMTHGIVKTTHWNGKCFSGKPELLAFLGSKKFATCSNIEDDDDDFDATSLS